MDLMTDDVVFMTPGNPPFGKEAFKQTAEEMKAGTTGGVRYEGTSEIEEINVPGDWAYLRARLNVATIPAGGGPSVYRTGYTLTILRKEPDGRWRVARDANLLAVRK